MKIFNKTFEVRTSKLYEFVDLEEEIGKFIKECGVKDGFCLIRICHTTAALVVTEKDPAVHRDFVRNLEKILPTKQNWEHSYEGSVNARAHQVAAWIGSSHWVFIRHGSPVLGTWQGVFFVELYEGRKRKVELVVVG
jgi:secondary thiamine-phosphate synthase enzyme